MNTIRRYLPTSLTAAGTDIIEPGRLGSYSFYEPYQIRHIRVALTPRNIESVLAAMVPGKSLVLDASVGVDAVATMRACARFGVPCVNTSLEVWDLPHPELLAADPRELYTRTLHRQHALVDREFGGRGPTMAYDCGMNPGAISHLILKGIRDAARRRDVGGRGRGRRLVSRADYARAAQALGLETVHVAELDTQDARKATRALANTWSPLGLYAEARDPVQLGHNPAAPRFAAALGEGHATPGRPNVRYYRRRGMDAGAETLVIDPAGREVEFRGYLIPHGEGDTASAYLEAGGRRPAVYYVYLPCVPARRALERLRAGGYREPARVKRVLTLPELRRSIGGRPCFDSVGAYLMFADGSGWWTGTVLTVADARALGFRHAGPTEIQVAASYLSAARWVLRNPGRGAVPPEALPTEEILRGCRPFFGRLVSRRVRARRPGWFAAAGAGPPGPL